MTNVEDDLSASMAQDETQSNNSLQLMKIHQMIQSHDNDHKISQQLNQCMIDDGLTVDILSHFDEKSLCQTINSWNINTFEKKISIRELLICGITKIKQNKNKITKTQTFMASQTEIKLFKKLTRYEQEIINKISTFEKQSKINQQNKDRYCI